MTQPIGRVVLRRADVTDLVIVLRGPAVEDQVRLLELVTVRLSVDDHHRSWRQRRLVVPFNQVVDALVLLFVFLD